MTKRHATNPQAIREMRHRTARFARANPQPPRDPLAAAQRDLETLTSALLAVEQAVGKTHTTRQLTVRQAMWLGRQVRDIINQSTVRQAMRLAPTSDEETA